MNLFVWILLLTNSIYSFPTFSTSELATVYTKISNYKQTFAIDFLNNKDAMTIMKVSLEQIFTNAIDKNRISLFFQLINWITQFFERLDISKKQKNLVTEPQIEFKIYEKLQTAINEYSNERKRRTVIEFFESIGEDGKFVEKDKVVGCSNVLMYGQNRVQCLKKYITLVKQPRTEYIGKEFLEPLMTFLNKPVPILKSTDVNDFAVLLDIPLHGPNIYQELFNKLIALKTRIPTPQYRTIYNQLMAEKEISLTPIPSTVSPVTHNTMVSVTPSALTPVTPTQVYTETTEHGVLILNPTPTQPTLEPENFPDLNNENSRFKFLLNEIRENERDIKTMQENINKLENTAGIDQLLKLEQEFLALEKKITERLTTGDTSIDDYNTKLLLLTNKLEELDLSDTKGINVQLKSKIAELERILAKMLESNHAKTTSENNEILTLKADVDAIKKALSESITIFNEEKDKLKLFVEPIKKLSSDVEKLKFTLENWDDTNPQEITKNDDSQRTHEMISKFLLVDAINKLIVECEHIKLLLSKPKESKYIPIFLNNAQIKYVYFSPAIPNIFVVDWEYYDDLENVYSIDPIPICDLKQCYLFVKQGFGNDTKMFQKSDCIKIIQDEYFCKNKINIKCPVYSKSCEIFDTVDFQPPKMVNNTHLSIFTTKQTKVLSYNLPLYTNILMSFDEDTTFKIDETEFFAMEFEQNETVKMVHLKIEDSLWSVTLYDIVMGCFAFGLTSLTITIISIVIVKYRKKKQTGLVRVNRSRVYFRADTNETSL